jgi:hypothetical protein
MEYRLTSPSLDGQKDGLPHSFHDERPLDERFVIPRAAFSSGIGDLAISPASDTGSLNNLIKAFAPFSMGASMACVHPDIIIINMVGLNG